MLQLEDLEPGKLALQCLQLVVLPGQCVSPTLMLLPIVPVAGLDLLPDAPKGGVRARDLAIEQG